MIVDLRRGLPILCGLLAGAIPSSAPAQSYPVKPIRMIVPWPPGGVADIVGRFVSQKINVGLGQPVVVENIPGASGILGTRALINAPKDGYTLITVTSGHTMNAAVNPKLPYNALGDVAPVIAVADGPSMLLVHPSLPVKTLKDLLAIAKARPGELTYASAGAGSPAHMFAELFKFMARIDLLHVPYRSGPHAITNVMGGHVMIYIAPFPVGLPQVEAGRLRALGTTGAQRSQLMPELPTVAEAGVAGYQASQWLGVLAPAGTPPEVINRVNNTIAKSLTAADSRQYLSVQGLEVFPKSNPGDFAALLKADVEQWVKVAKAMNITVD